MVAYPIEVDPLANASSTDESADDAGYDSDSVYGSAEEDTVSLVSAAMSYTYENGRRYHGFDREGSRAYLYPNDEAEQERMDLQHHINLLLLKGELFTAPVKNPKRILDVGTGSGIWAIDVADTFPEAEVIGVDLSPIQPSWVPTNLRFEVDDIESEWEWPPNHFDYIHVRFMAGWIKDWPLFVRQAYRALKPGGYLELHDQYDYFHSDDNSVPANSSVQRWVTLLDEAIGKARGLEWVNAVKRQEEFLAGGGFEDVTKNLYQLPVGPWPKDERLKALGLCVRQHEIDSAEGFSLAPFTRVLGWELDDVKELLDKVKGELMERRIHSYIKSSLSYGRKPLVSRHGGGMDEDEYEEDEDDEMGDASTLASEDNESYFS